MKDYPRVKYNNCPLVEVVFQINFPVILSIDTDEPAKFQERIRKKFPNYRVSTIKENNIIINTGNPEIKPTFMQRQDKKQYEFISEDGAWKISLSKNHIAISTLSYKIWEDMCEKFEIPFKAFIDVYEPSYFQRIGLRYTDVFNKQKLGLENVRWDELIKPHLLGCLSYSGVGENVFSNNSVTSEFIIDNKDEKNIYVRVNSGIGTFFTNGKSMKNSFILACDYFSKERTDINKGKEVAELLHNASTKFLRDSITERLHEAMQPKEI